MFNDKLAKSIAEAAKKVMDEELKGNQHKIDANKNNKIDAHDFKLLRAKKDMKEENVTEAMQKADVPAYLRKQQGEKPLTVADVKGPRKDSISHSANLAKARNEEVEQVTEAEKVATPTGMKVYGSSYGNSQKARREQIRKSIDTAKGPKASEMTGKKKFTEMVELYKETGIKGLMESLVVEEPTNDEYHAEVKKAQDKSLGKDKAEVAKAAVQAVQQESVEQVEERSLTEPEMKKKEEVVKSMKKGIEGFKQRYGERAKEVMYATATKIAKKD